MVAGGEQAELRRPREENARLKELLTQHGIACEEPAISEPVPAPTESAPAPTHFTTDDKTALFRRLFLGRKDVFPQRRESAKGASGYSPACGNAVETRHLPQAPGQMRRLQPAAITAHDRSWEIETTPLEIHLIFHPRRFILE